MDRRTNKKIFQCVIPGKEKIMKITCRNCDGEIETVEIKKIEVYQGADGDFEAKAILEDGDYFLLFGKRLGNVKIED
jgi:hypothetical protein